MKTIFFFSSFLFLFNKRKKKYKIVSHFSYFFNAGNVNDEIIFFFLFSFLKSLEYHSIVQVYMICKYYMWELIDFEQFLLVSLRMDGSMPCILISIECLSQGQLQFAQNCIDIKKSSIYSVGSIYSGKKMLNSRLILSKTTSLVFSQITFILLKVRYCFYEKKKCLYISIQGQDRLFLVQ